jgi:hypothetical protein
METEYVERMLLGDFVICAVVYGVEYPVREGIDAWGCKLNNGRVLYSGCITEEDWALLVAARVAGTISAECLAAFTRIPNPNKSE